MQRWYGIGNFIGAKMPVLVLACAALGVLLPQTFSPFEAVVPVLFAFMTYQGALGNTARQLAEVFRRPFPLLAVLGITLALMPVVAHALACGLFPGNIPIITGILIEYTVPIGIVSFMWVGMFNGNTSLALAAILVSTVIAPVSIPLTLKLLMGKSIQVDVVGMILNMVFMIALPALAGMLTNDLTHGWGKRTLSPALSPACKMLLLLIITSNSTQMSDYVLHMTWDRMGVMVFILLFAISGFIWGFIAARCMGSAADETVTVTFDCGLRNISSGAVIATQYFTGEAVFPVMCGTIFQQLLAALAGRAMRTYLARRR